MNIETVSLPYILYSYETISLFTYKILIHAIISNVLKIALPCPCPRLSNFIATLDNQNVTLCKVNFQEKYVDFIQTLHDK